MILGSIEGGTEHASVCKEFLTGLLDRGLIVEQGVLCVMDGSKRINKAVQQVFGGSALIQRYQWHKRGNVVSYVSKGSRPLSEHYYSITHQR